MTRSQKTWWYQHGRGKIRYRTRRAAWGAVLQIWVRERRFDSLQPYACQLGPDPAKGRSYPMHYHIGHGRYTPAQRAARRFRRLVVYPFFRCRRRVRQLIRR